MKTFKIPKLLFSFSLVVLGVCLIREDGLFWINLFTIIINSVIIGSILTSKK